MNLSKEQLKGFWEQCGLHYEVPYWVDNKGQVAFYGETYSELLKSLDLNSLFKHAVPILQKRGNPVVLEAFECSGFLGRVYKDCFTQRPDGGFEPFLEPIAECRDENPALALFWAIHKTFGGKE